MVLVSKTEAKECNTYYAQGGLAAVFGKDDSAVSHVEDTLRAGDGLSDKRIARILAEGAPRRIKELDSLGVPFNKKGKRFRLSREAVHSRPRIVHCTDITGKKIEEVLLKKVKAKKRITIIENTLAVDLIIDKGLCIGCKFLDNKRSFAIFAKKVILAAGGLGRLYKTTSNPDVTTGDGIAMAFRSGAILEDMEFIQFHPTLLHDSDPPFLISETLRGEGGLLKNKYNKTYMKKYHRDGELAPRDVVSRFSLVEMKKNRSKNVYLDMTHMDPVYLKKRFPHINEECLKYKIDFTKDPIPVSPAAHYICGGIRTDSKGRTNIRNLYAIGECACTRLHGADRLASNSMTEGLVFGRHAVMDLKQGLRRQKIVFKDVDEMIISPINNGRIKKLRQQLQVIMERYVGIIRNKKGLMTAKEKISRIEKKFSLIRKTGKNIEIVELENMLQLAKIIIFAAQRRKESRGTHFLQEYHERFDNVWQKHLSVDISTKKLQ